MADRVTSSSAGIENLVQQLEKDADFPFEVKDQVRSFQAELKKVSSFLNYSEAHLKEEEAAELESQIRDLTFDIENTIYRFILYRAQQKSSRRRKVGKLLHCFSGKHKICDATARMVSMKEKLRKICDAKGKDGDGGGSGSSRSGGFGMTTVEEADHVVGFDGEAEVLVRQLMMIEGDSRRQEVVSIVGMEGLGKTTLAKKIYNHGFNRGHFGCRAWVHVPQEYKTADLLRCILKHIVPTTEEEVHEEEANEEGLKELLSGRLRDRRYLIIMDNVWQKEIWDEVKSAFPDDSNGSRILLTSRLEEVASYASPRLTHRLGFLSNDDSWELLRRKALKGSNSCPDDLVEIGKQMAKKCDGLPLAIVLLGGILARKEMTVETWSMLADNISKNLLNLGKRGKDIALSYHNLPQHLKKCLLYFGMFPEDYEIPVRQLIQLWIAEGFVEVVKGTQRMEDVGEEYLKELIGQCLIQVGARRTDGGVKTCRILKLLRELCISIAEEKKLFLVHANAESCNHAGWEPQRLVVHPHPDHHHNSGFPMETLLESNTNYEQLSSLQCYASGSLGHIGTIRLWRSLYNGFPLLRLLNLGSIKVGKIPRGVKKLLYLQYLRVNAPDLTHIPRSICNLMKLQTLDLRESSMHHIVPSGIWKMKELRHLHLGSSACLPEPDHDKAALWNLQTLSGVCPDAVLKRLMVKAKFPNVTKLSISSFNRQATLNFLESLDHLYHLQTLKIVNPCDLPDPNAFPLTLTKITLKQTNLPAPDCIHKLEKLPNLHILKLLDGSVLGPDINCNAGCFPQLQVLYLAGLETETWNVGSGAMRSIRRLVIRDCPKLARVPDFASCMTTLQEVEILNPPSSSSAKLREALKQLQEQTGCTVRIDPTPAA